VSLIAFCPAALADTLHETDIYTDVIGFSHFDRQVS